MKKYIIASLAAASCIAGSSTASAVVVTVTEGGVVVASWEQSQNPILTPDDYSLGDYADIPVFNAIGLAGDLDVFWYDPTNNGGGLSSFNGNLNIVGGPTLTIAGAFSGPTSAPQFQLGTYFGIDLTDSAAENIPATITIASNGADPGSVPEPGTWAMLLVGLGVTGLAVRSNRAVSVNHA